MDMALLDIPGVRVDLLEDLVDEHINKLCHYIMMSHQPKILYIRNQAIQIHMH